MVVGHGAASRGKLAGELLRHRSPVPHPVEAQGLQALHVREALARGGDHLACTKDPVHVVALESNGLRLVRIEVGRRLEPGQNHEALVVELARQVGIEVVLREAEEVVPASAEGGDGLRGGEQAVGVGGVAVEVALVAREVDGQAGLVAEGHGSSFHEGGGPGGTRSREGRRARAGSTRTLGMRVEGEREGAFFLPGARPYAALRAFSGMTRQSCLRRVR